MQDPCNDKTHFDRLKPEAKSDLDAKDNLHNKNAEVIDLEAYDSAYGDEQKAQYSAKPFGTDDSTLNPENKSSVVTRPWRVAKASDGEVSQRRLRPS